MIKILFFVDTLRGGGASKVLRDLVNAMDKSKFAITVQTLYPEENARELAEGIRYRYCYGAKNRMNNMRMRLEAALGLTYSLHIKDDYDIEAAYLECGSTKIMAGSSNKNALKLAWVHCDLEKNTDDAAAFVRKTEKHYSKFDEIICVSEDVRRSFVQMYPNAPECKVVYNCYNDAEITAKAEKPLPQDAKKRRITGVAVGRLMPQKAFDRLLKIHKRLADEGIEYDLWILGDGCDREMLERYIAENGLSDSVTLWGFQENPYPFIKEADFLVCSSRYEGFSTVAVEGTILGTPMITTDCTGMKELLGNSEYGLITENDDEALYCGLKRMLTEDGLLEHYAKRAMQRGGDFRQSVLAGKTEAVLETLLAQKRHNS